MKRILILIFVFSAFLEAGIIENYSDRDISEFYKDKNYDILVLNYWATYCLPCKKEMPDFDKLYKKYKDKNVLVLGVSIDGIEKASFIKKLLKKLKIEYPVLYGADSEFQGIEVSGLPKTFILDKDGEILREIEGKREFEYFDKILEEYLNNSTFSKETKEKNALESTYYYFEISKVEGNKEIKIMLRSKEGIHFNGEGYPKLVVELENPNIFERGKAVLEVEGLDEGAEKIWTLPVKDYEKAENIKVRIKAIVCTENSCKQVKDDFEWTL